MKKEETNQFLEKDYFNDLQKIKETIRVNQNKAMVVVNSAMVTGTELASVCHIADDKRELADLCRQLSATPVTAQQIAQRKQLLAQYYDNKQLGLTLLNNL